MIDGHAQKESYKLKLFIRVQDLKVGEIWYKLKKKSNTYTISESRRWNTQLLTSICSRQGGEY